MDHIYTFPKTAFIQKHYLDIAKSLEMSKAVSMKLQRKPTNSMSPTKEPAIGDLCFCGVVWCDVNCFMYNLHTEINSGHLVLIAFIG